MCVRCVRRLGVPEVHFEGEDPSCVVGDLAPGGAEFDVGSGQLSAQGQAVALSGDDGVAECACLLSGGLVALIVLALPLGGKIRREELRARRGESGRNCGAAGRWTFRYSIGEKLSWLSRGGEGSDEYEGGGAQRTSARTHWASKAEAPKTPKAENELLTHAVVQLRRMPASRNRRLPYAQQELRPTSGTRDCSQSHGNKSVYS